MRNFHVEQGAGNPFANTTLPDLVFRGVKRKHGAHSRLERLPITLLVLRKLLAHLRGRQNRAESLMLAAACSLAFFGFLRAGELLALIRADTAIEANRLAVPTVHIKSSKTDPFRQGCTVYAGKATDQDLCPVGLVTLHMRSASVGRNERVFQVMPGQAITRERFVELLQVALMEWGGGGGLRILALTKATAFALARLPQLERQGYPSGSSRPWDTGRLARTRPTSGRILELSQVSLPVSLNGTHNTHCFTDLILSLSFSHCIGPLGSGHGALGACLRFGPAISASITRSSYAHTLYGLLCGKHWIEQTPSLQDFCLRLIIPPENKYSPENKYLFRR